MSETTRESESVAWRELKRAAQLVTSVLGAGSFFLLFQQGFEFGVAMPLQAVFAQYDEWVHWVGEAVKPLFDGLLWVLNQTFAWDLHLASAWKHYMIAWGVVVAATARVPFALALKAAGAMLTLAAVLLASVVPEGSEKLSGPAGDPSPAVALWSVLSIAGLSWLWDSRKGSREDREGRLAIAWTLLSVPLVTILYLVANAGLQALPN